MAARKKRKKNELLGSFKPLLAKGIREDLSDAIYNISPKDTPFFAGQAKQSIFEWQTDVIDRGTDPRWSAHDAEKLGEEWGLCAKCSLATKNKLPSGVWEHSFCPNHPTPQIVGAADVYESDFGSISVVPNRIGKYTQISRKVVIVDKDLLRKVGK